MSKVVDYLKTRNFYINIGIATATVIVVVLIAFFSLGYYTRHGEGVPVPNLEGMQADKAIALLDQQGFHDPHIDSVYVLEKLPERLFYKIRMQVPTLKRTVLFT